MLLFVTAIRKLLAIEQKNIVEKNLVIWQNLVNELKLIYSLVISCS